MAYVKFQKGLSTNLPTSNITEGTFYITTDDGNIYLGTDSTTIKALGNCVVIADIANLPATPNTEVLYYAIVENILCRYNGSAWIQINADQDTQYMILPDDNDNSIYYLYKKSREAMWATPQTSTNFDNSGDIQKVSTITTISLTTTGTGIVSNITKTGHELAVTKTELGDISLGDYTVTGTPALPITADDNLKTALSKLEKGVEEAQGTTYDLTVEAGDVSSAAKIALTDSDNVKDTVKFVNGENITITPNATDGTITIQASGGTITLEDNTSGNVVTSLSLNERTFTELRSNLTALALTGYTKGSASLPLAATDTLGEAFSKVEVAIGAMAGGLIYKGTIGTGGTVTALPTTYGIGWTYRVITAGTYVGNVCEVGDMLISIIGRTGSGNLNSDWTVVQNNVEVFTGATSATAGGVGLVPAPSVGEQNKFLSGGGTWKNETTYALGSNASASTGIVKLTGSNGTTNLITLTGSGTTSVSSDGSGGITITSTDADTKNTAGATQRTGKLFLIGAQTQTANPQTYSNVNVYIGTDGCLYSNGEKVLTGDFPATGVTSITAGSGLTGGTITSTGTIAHSNNVTAKTVVSADMSVNIGSAFAVNDVLYDETGHITSVGSRNYTVNMQWGNF